MEKIELHKLIDLYFEGNTSVEEEKRLLRILLSLPELDCKCASALAVMGYARHTDACNQKQKPPIAKKRQNWRKVIVNAAAVATIGLAGAGFITEWHSNSTSVPSECFAYINGEKTENDKLVKSLIAQQLGEVSVASELLNDEVANNLNDITKALNTEGL